MTRSCNSRRTALAGFVALAFAGFLAGCNRSSASTEKAPIRIAAAAVLSNAFAELAQTFEQETGERVSLSFTASGLAARQLEQGAPFDLFASANTAYVDTAVASGACDGATKTVYARGRVALWSAQGVTPPQSLADLVDPRFVRVAVANPEHAPYGIAAREAMTATGIWEQLQPRIVRGENVRQAVQFAETGNAEVALVPLGLVIQKKEGAWQLLDEELHAPINQALVVCKRGARSDGGRAFADFLGSPRGREVMRRHGFLLPGEAVPSP